MDKNGWLHLTYVIRDDMPDGEANRYRDYMESSFANRIGKAVLESPHPILVGPVDRKSEREDYANGPFGVKHTLNAVIRAVDINQPTLAFELSWAESNTLARIRRLNLWQRIKFLFNGRIP